MKKILILLAMSVSGGTAFGQVVNNSGNTAADSLSLPFYMLDSGGYNTVLIATTDTIFLIVFRPNGVIAFEDSIPQGNARISDNNVSTDVGQYALKLAVADIDGAGADGVFSYTIIADDESLDLQTAVRGTFQLYQSSDYNTWATRLQDSLQAIIDSMQLVDEKYISLRDSINLIHAEVNNVDGFTVPAIGLAFWNTSATTAFTAGSMGDSAIGGGNAWGQGGGAGSTDSGLVARIVKRTGWGLAVGAGSDSTTAVQRVIGSNLTEQGGIAGANRTWSVYVIDTSGSDTPIPSADVDVQLTNGTVKLRGTTNASGLVTFTVTDGSWVLVSQETGYVLNLLSKTIAGNNTDTVKGFDIQVGAPSSPALCRVYGYVYSVEAVPDDGVGVAAFLPAGVARSGNLIISPFSVSTITDSLGYFYLDLIRSDSLVPAGTLYDLIINRKDGTMAHKRITVPNQASWLVQW